jgi:hypothetical protein
MAAILRMGQSRDAGDISFNTTVLYIPSPDELGERPIRRTSQRPQARKGLILVRLILLRFF